MNTTRTSQATTAAKPSTNGSRKGAHIGARNAAVGVTAAALIGGGIAAFFADSDGNASLASPTGTLSTARHTPGLASDSTSTLPQLTLANPSAKPAANAFQSLPTPHQALDPQDPRNLQLSQSSPNLMTVTADGTSVTVSTDAIKTATALASSTQTYVGQVKTNAVRALADTASWATTAVSGVSGAAVRTVASQVQTVGQTAIRVVSAVEGVSMNLQILGNSIHTQLTPTGTVTVTTAGGASTSASVDNNGGCTVSISNAPAGTSVTLHYSGDATHLPTSLVWVVPRV